MKDKWRNYATKNRLLEKGYFKKHSDRSTVRKAREASGSHSLQQSRKEQEEKIEFGREIILTENVVPNVPFSQEEQIALGIYGKALKEVYEERREEKSIEAPQGRQKRIPRADKRRQKAGKVSQEKEEVAKEPHDVSLSEHESVCASEEVVELVRANVDEQPVEQLAQPGQQRRRQRGNSNKKS